jgi:hypothetical protein
VSVCNATLTTATETEGRGVPRGVVPPDGVYRIKDGVIVANVTLHTLTCEESHWDHLGRHHAFGSMTNPAVPTETWRDGTPGATPHVEPLVSEAEVDAARVAWMLADKITEMNDYALEIMTAVLEATAKARQDNKGNKT